jgi:hypothetical protein
MFTATIRFVHEDSAPISLAAAALALEAAGDSQELKPCTNLFTPSLWAIGAPIYYLESRVCELYLVPADFYGSIPVSSPSYGVDVVFGANHVAKLLGMRWDRFVALD